MLVGPILMEGVERTNAVMTCFNQRAGFAPWNLYAIDMDRGDRNCYSCKSFKHLARNCRNKENKIGEGRRLEYGQNNR